MIRRTDHLRTTMKPNPSIRAEILRRAGEVMRRKHLSLTTERDYSGWIGRS